MRIGHWLLPLIGILCLCYAFCLVDLDPNLSTSSMRAPVNSVSGFQHTSDGFVTASHNTDEKMLQCVVGLEKNADYVVTFEITAASGPVDLLVVDIIGSGYDNDAQEFHLSIKKGQVPLRVRRVLNAGTPPPDARLRIFYYSPATLTIRDIDVRKLNSAYHGVKTTALILGSLCLFIFGLLAWRRGVFAAFASVWMAWIQRNDSRIEVVLAALAISVPLMPWLYYSAEMKYPFVFADEMTYFLQSKYAGHPSALAGNPLTNKVLPNAVYFKIYSMAHLAEDHVLLVARFFNVGFLALSLMLLYWTLRRFAGRWTTAAVVFTIGLGAGNTYALYFMPETMYAFLFSLLVFVLVRFLDTSPLVACALAGAVLGTQSLVKPHGLMLVPIVVVVLICLRISFPERFSRPLTVQMIVVLLLSMGVVRLCLTELAGSPVGVFSVGSAYGSMTASALQATSLRKLCFVLGGHMGALLLIWSVPLVLVCLAAVRRHSVCSDGPHAIGLRALILLTFVTLLVHLVTTSKFTIGIAGSGPFESVNRLHARYYAFVLPWLVVSYFAVVSKVDWKSSSTRWLLRAFLLAATAVCVWFGLRGVALYSPGFADCPDLSAFVLFGARVQYVICILLAALPLLYAYRLRLSGTVYLVVLCVWSIAASATLVRFLHGLGPTPADRAGRLFRHIVGEVGASEGLVLFDSTSLQSSDLYRLMYHLSDAPDGRYLVQGVSSSERVTYDNYRWILDTTGQDVEIPHAEMIRSGPYRLFLRGPTPAVRCASQSNKANQEEAQEKGRNLCEAARFQGFNAPEPWGLWSSVDGASVVLANPIQGKFVLELQAATLPAFGGRELRVRVGKSVRVVTLGSAPRQYKLEYVIESPVNRIVFEGISGASPLSLGMSTDPRVLGIAVSGMDCRTK